MPRSLASALAFVPLLVAACGASGAPAPLQPIPPGTVAPAPIAAPLPSPARSPAPGARRAAEAGASCAMDAAWLAQVGGRPVRSTLMRFDAMRLRGGFGTGAAVETFNEFGAVVRSVEEKYEWAPRNPHDSNAQLVVLRNASGSIPRIYSSPKAHPSGVMEYGETPRPYPFEELSNGALFVFPDGTWVRTMGTSMAAAVRAAFAIPGTPPAAASADADVAWEVCGAMDANELSLPFDLWSIEGDRVVARLFSSRPDGELVYTFTSPELAARAAAEQAARCTRTPCTWVTSSGVEGPLVRYGVTVTTAPTTLRNDLEVAYTTPALAAPPAANAKGAPGAPPSGVYQQWVDIRSDDCPTRSTGQHFTSFMEPILITHRNGRAFTTLDSSDPRAPGIMTSSAMKDVELAVGKVVTNETTHLCKNYKIVRTMTVLAISGDLIRVRDEVRHVGSTAGCRHPNLSSNCGHEAITTWKLARKACDAACDASLVTPWRGVMEGEPAPRLDAKCACP